MKYIIMSVTVSALAAVLLSSCEKETCKGTEGVFMTIDATVVTPVSTRMTGSVNDEGGISFSWDSEESITVISFNRSGITAVDEFDSYGEEGRDKAVFSGTWTGNEGDKVICLYPSVETYEGASIFDGVRVGSPTIYIRNLSVPASPLKDNDLSEVSSVDVMIGEVDLDKDLASVRLSHQISVFRIEATLVNVPYEAPYGSPYDQARVNSISISARDPNAWNEDDQDVVFVRMSGIDVNTEGYTGEMFPIELGKQDYYLLDSGNNSSFSLIDEDQVKMTFYVPVRTYGDLEEGYELIFRFGGNYYDDDQESRVSIDAFPAGVKRKVITEKLTIEKGKVYSFKVTI